MGEALVLAHNNISTENWVQTQSCSALSNGTREIPFHVVIVFILVPPRPGLITVGDAGLHEHRRGTEGCCRGKLLGSRDQTSHCKHGGMPTLAILHLLSFGSNVTVAIETDNQIKPARANKLVFHLESATAVL